MRGRKWYKATSITLRIIRRLCLSTFVYASADEEQKTVKRYMIEILSHHLVIFRHWDKLVVAALEICLIFCDSSS